MRDRVWMRMKSARMSGDWYEPRNPRKTPVHTLSPHSTASSSMRTGNSGWLWWTGRHRKWMMIDEYTDRKDLGG